MDSIKRYLKFVKPYTFEIVVTIFIGIIKFAIPLLTPLFIQYIIDDVIGAPDLNLEQKATKLAIAFGIMAFLFLIVRPPIEYYRQYYAQLVGSKILYDIRDRLFTHIQKLSFKFYSNNRSGEIISRMINDVEQTKNFVITGLMNIWLDLATLLIAIGIMMQMDVKLTLVSLIMFPIYAICVKYFFGNLRKLTKDRSQALAEVQGYLHERVGGMALVQSFAVEDYEQTQFDKQNTNFLTKAIAHTKWNAKSFAWINTITDIAPIIVIGFAGYEVLQGNLTVGTMAAFIAYQDKLYGPLRRLVTSSTTLTQALASMDRMFELFDEKYDIEDKPNAIECKETKGLVTIENVDFKYNDKELEVLNKINLEVKSGMTVAFVGMSGGGKSTLASLIPRFYDVSSGRILLDHVDIRDYKVRSLRDKIGMVLQDTILFSESVKSNILIGKPNATDEEIVEAAKAANAHEFIINLPNGYDTKVGERGVKLSGGQKQRIAIARVFLKNPAILILDEATSALDLESEHLIQESLDLLAKNRTTFIIAHRLSTITHANLIVVMEHGQIVEQGTHDELMKKQGAYHRLFTVQQLN